MDIDLKLLKFNVFHIEKEENLEETEDIFVNLHSIFKLIIYFSGLYYNTNNENILFKIFNILFILFSLFTLAVSVYFGFEIIISYAFLYSQSLNINNDKSEINTIINGILFGIIFALQSIVLLPSYYFINKKLQKKINKTELVHYSINSIASIISLTYLITMWIFSIIFPSKALIPNGYTISIYYFFIEYIICLITTVILYLLLVDISVSNQDLDDLRVLYLELLTNTNKVSEFDENGLYKSYIKTKKKILKNIKKTFLQITCVLFIAILNVLYIIYNVFQTTYPTLYDEISENCFFIKEIPFICIIMYYSAILNEKSDKINKLLLYKIYPNDLRNEQLLTFNIAKYKQIILPIFGYGLRRKQVFFHWISFCFTLFFGFIKKRYINK